MKIVHCYIDNFGTLSDKHYDFKRDITSFCRENGEGKTTLAAFFKAMFYGLDTDKKNKGFNDRRHYAPFNNGKFGGNLEIEKDGKIYTITRTFDRKSASKDTVNLYIGADEQNLPEDIGVFFFGMNKESFERTVFIGADDIEISTTADISAKLSGYVDNTDNDVGYDKAVKILSEARKSIKGDKKAPNAKLTKLESKIDKLNSDIFNEEQNYTDIEECYIERNDLAQEIKNDEKELSRLNEIRVELGYWEKYDTYSNNIDEAKEKLLKLNQNYPKGLPKKEEITVLSNSSQIIRQIENEINSSSFKYDQELENLERIFKNGIPTQEEISNAEKAINDEMSISGKIEAYEESLPTEHQKDILDRFTNKELSDELIAKAEEYISKIVIKQRELDELSVPNGTQALSTFPLILAIIIIMAGCAASALLNIYVGIILLFTGVVILVFSFFKNNQKSDNSTQKATVKAEIKVCEDTVNEMLVPFGYFSKNGVTATFTELKKDYEEYKELISQQIANNQSVDDLKGEQDELKNKTDNFFRQFNNEFEDIISLKQSIQEFNRLKDEKKECDDKCKNLLKTLSDNKEIFCSIIEKYSINVEDDSFISNLQSDKQCFDIYTQDIENNSKKAEEYKAEKGLKTRPVDIVDESTVRKLEEKISENKQKIASLDETIRQKEESKQRVEEKNAELKKSEEEHDELSSKHKLISATEKFLKQAEQQLRDRYVIPVENDCRQYASQLESALGERVVMNKDYSIFYKKDGQNREIQYLSTGQRTLAALCFRLALTDNMFPKNRPFLILDDPFMGLDENHMNKAAKLLKELAKGRQIIYFCAHESRII